MTSTSSLAARTARESRPEIDNQFASVRHSSVFDGIPPQGRDADEAIQKIISAPILNGETVIGVLQVSRKRKDIVHAGPHFMPADLGKVLALCRPHGKLLRHFAAE